MRAEEFVKPHQMAKLEKTGRIVEILRHQDQVDFSDEPGWYLINLEPGKRVAPDMKWIPDSTRFLWVREFKRADAVAEDITPNTIHKLRANEFLVEYRDDDDDQTAHRDGLDLESIQVGSDFQVTASCHDRQLARVIFKKSGDTLVPRDLSVEERYRGQGIAAVMYDWVKDLGYKIQRSPDQSQAGQAFWDKNRGEEGRVWEATDLEDRFKKYIKPTVKTTPKIERITNPAGRTTDHVEYKVTGPTGMVHRFKSKKEAEAHYSSFTEQEMWEDNDTAISLSKLGKFHPGADTLAEFVPERATAQYALHPNKWESTFYSLTNKDSDKLKYYGPKKISIPPGTLVGDMAIANKFYRAKTTEEKQQYAEAYKASLQPYPVDVSKYRMPELLIPKQGVVENFADGKRQNLDFDKIYGKYLKVTDNNGNPDNPGFSIVTPLNGASWHWHERPEFKQLVKQKLNDPEFLGDHKYQQIIDAMAGNKFDPARHLYKENFADGKGPGRPGDSQRHGIPKGATMAELERASHAKGRKGQLARWQLNMRRGKKK